MFIRKLYAIPIVILSLLQISGGCKKEEKEVPVDYRVPYYGLYRLQVIHTFMTIRGTHTIDTSWREGQIRGYDGKIDPEKLYTVRPHREDSAITIVLENLFQMSTDLYQDGTFANRGDYHYHHSGGFVGKDSVSFEVDGLGGLGFSHLYEVRGKRK